MNLTNGLIEQFEREQKEIGTEAALRKIHERSEIFGQQLEDHAKRHGYSPVTRSATPPPASETCPHAQLANTNDGKVRCMHCGAIGWINPMNDTFYVNSPETSTRPAMTPEVAEMAKRSLITRHIAKLPMNTDSHITLNKELRRDIDEIIQRLKKGADKNFTGMRAPDAPVRASRERSLAVTKLQEAVMWLEADEKDTAQSSTSCDQQPK